MEARSELTTHRLHPGERPSVTPPPVPGTKDGSPAVAAEA